MWTRVSKTLIWSNSQNTSLVKMTDSLRISVKVRKFHAIGKNRLLWNSQNVAGLEKLLWLRLEFFWRYPQFDNCLRASLRVLPDLFLDRILDVFLETLGVSFFPHSPKMSVLSPRSSLCIWAYFLNYRDVLFFLSNKIENNFNFEFCKMEKKKKKAEFLGFLIFCVFYPNW